MEINRINFLLSDLAVDLTLYSQLYGPEESVATLNEFNGLVFGRLQHCLIDRIFLGFARFMDVPESRVKGGSTENLSLKFIVRENDLEGDKEISARLQAIEDKYRCANLGQYRNKRLSHNDLKVALGDAKVDVSITPNDAHKLLSDMMNLVATIELKTGRTDKSVGKSSHITLPRDKDGYAFLARLKKCV